MTHHLERIGHLIWMAGPIFDDEPSVEDVSAIAEWRWPVFLPLGAALHRRIVTRIGQVEIPVELRAFPRLRSSNLQGGWNEVQVIDDKIVGPTTDHSLPIYKAVNDTRLKEMLVTNWRPSDEW